MSWLLIPLIIYGIYRAWMCEKENDQYERQLKQQQQQRKSRNC